MSNNSKLNHDFLKQYSAVFADKLLQKAYQDKSHLTGKDILNLSSIKQLNLFVIKAFFTEWQEEVKKLESPLFDYQNRDVRKAMVNFMNILSQHIHISQKHLKPYIEQALLETVSLTFDPAGYLHNAFGDNKAIRLGQKQIKPLMKYLVSYKDALLEYLESVEGDSVRDALSKAELYFEDFETEASFDELLESLSKYLVVSASEILQPTFPIREEVVHEIAEEEWDDKDEEIEEAEEPQTELHTTSSDYFGRSFHGEEISEDQVQEEEEADEEYEEKDEPVEEWDEEEDLDEEVKETYDQEDEEEPEVEDEDWDEEELDRPAESENEEEEEDLEPEPDEELLEEEQPSVSEVSSLPEEQDADDDRDTINSKFEEHHKTLAEVHEEKGVNSVFDAISINHRYMFLQELFDGDNELFTTALKEVDACETFDEAVEMLVQSYAKEFFWDMNSEEVKELLKVIYRKFRS